MACMTPMTWSHVNRASKKSLIPLCSARIFFFFICAACNFFLPTSACRKLFFKITHPPPPQELNGRPLTVSDLWLLLLLTAAAWKTESKSCLQRRMWTPRFFVSFFLCESSGSAATQAIQGDIHKEKFNVPIDASHKDLHNFTKHVVAEVTR